ncbi:tetratricopeptide repeat protein [Nibricoccus sp. IMCC34717]|uniref:tetratricopeptide repeat protein n=1 Tax=Nibricoccus sp. IMCC34717 TaxID=3034021 RepID=UPI00384C2DFE
MPSLLRTAFLVMAMSIACVGVQAQTVGLPDAALNRPSPLVASASEGQAGTALREISARRALEAGLVSIAVSEFKALIDQADVTVATRNRLSLDLCSALLVDGQPEEAGRALLRYAGPQRGPVRLRRALVAFAMRRMEEARATLAALKAEDFEGEEQDLAWWHHARGLLAEETRDFRQASEQYQRALDASTNELQRGWFTLAAERAKLAAGGANDAAVTSLRQTLDRSPGRATAYAATSQLAIALNSLGRRGEAVALLQQQLPLLPRAETQVQDEWRLLLGLIAGTGDAVGRTSLRALITLGADRDKQRAALRALLESATAAPRQDELRGWLDEWVNSAQRHPILEDLLYVRSRLVLLSRSEGLTVQAERDATRILEEFPGSRLRVPALEQLCALAWRGGFYRNAASYATRAREELPKGQLRTRLAAVVAEAYYRGRDFRNAADAYRVAIAEGGADGPSGDLIFQWVLSLIEAEALDEAQAALAQFGGDSRLDVVNRWQAEWNLARALRIAGRVPDALRRISALLGKSTEDTALPAELRARMAWLEMRLFYDVGDFNAAVARAESLAGVGEGVPEPLRSEIASNATLLKAQALLAQRETNGKTAALEVLRRLRADHPKSAAAVYSFLVEADHEAAQGHPVEAQKLLRRLADEYRESEYAPYALFQAALHAERRGAPEHYNEAYRILEEMIRAYPETPLVFHARLRQGNLLRLLNDFGGARTLYQDLVNRYRLEQTPDVFSAHLALADCYAADESAGADSAAAIYERLLAQPAAPLDLRVEAGCKLGLGLQARRNFERARAVWWQLANEFLVDSTRAERLGANGRYWIARALVSLARLLEDQGRPREAATIYQMVLDRGLPGGALAQEGLSRTGSSPRP